MSADLLAEFDSFCQKPPQQGQSSSKSQDSGIASGDLFVPASFSAGNPPFKPAQPAQPWTSSVPSNHPPNIGGGWGDLSLLSQPATHNEPYKPGQQDNDEDDTWGDFETAEPTPSTEQWPSAHTSKGVNAGAGAHAPSAGTAPRGPSRITRASTFDIMSNNIPDIGGMKSGTEQHPDLSSMGTTDVQNAQPKPARSAPRNEDPNVLFDAEDYGSEEDQRVFDDDYEDDEFGDFETGVTTPTRSTLPMAKQKPAPAPAPAPVSALASMDLLSLDDDVQPPSQPKEPISGFSSWDTTLPSHSQLPSSAAESASPANRKVVPKPATASSAAKDHKRMSSKVANSQIAPSALPSFGQTSSKPPPKTQSQKVVAGLDDDWESFEDFPPEPGLGKTEPKAKAQPVETANDWGWDDAASPEAPANPGAESLTWDDKAPPPTNIPPPSVLLSIFPELLNLADTSLFKPLASQPSSIKDRVTSDTATVTFLRAYLLLATVAARVIAGRKSRWHRDKFLAQGMAISAAGAKGMKLAGVDRAQAAREDREAADVVTVWKDQVGKLRSAVAAANTTFKGKTQLKVPELSQNMAVTTAKMVPTSSKACIVCGLKRDERVGKIDFDVEDSFGEWWVDHWGHRACKNFWTEHEKQLRQR